MRRLGSVVVSDFADAGTLCSSGIHTACIGRFAMGIAAVGVLLLRHFLDPEARGLLGGERKHNLSGGSKVDGAVVLS